MKLLCPDQYMYMVLHCGLIGIIWPNPHVYLTTGGLWRETNTMYGVQYPQDCRVMKLVLLHVE